ncbi:MAG: FAD-binding oxidoreductase [Waddliaceae bacterium]
MDNWTRYRTKKESIVQQFRRQCHAGEEIRLKKRTSNLFRRQNRQTGTLDVHCLNQVIAVNPDRLIADVEGMTTYEDLVKETIKNGCLPAVVPELKSITIGGALSGIGIESSSFRYGLVHETVKEIELLTGTGEVITCTPDNPHRELFYGIPNSYGTLGYALRVQVKLIPIKPYVKLTHIKFTDPNTYYSALKDICLCQRESGSIAYVDGTIFSENELYLTLGELVDKAPFVNDYRYRKIFYQSIRQKPTDYLATEDYIWRWDADWFWCSKAFLMQNPILRMLLGKWMLRSTVYWKIRQVFKKFSWLNALYHYFSGPGEAVIQDVAIPIENSPDFFDFFFKEIRIKPVWNCPVMSYASEGSFGLFRTDPKKLYVNFGFWAIVPTQRDTPQGYYNRKVEAKVQALDGLKSLYSDVYYPRDVFWQIYDDSIYRRLKETYDPLNVFQDLYTKCTTKRSA